MIFSRYIGKNSIESNPYEFYNSRLSGNPRPGDVQHLNGISLQEFASQPNRIELWMNVQTGLTVSNTKFLRQL